MATLQQWATCSGMGWTFLTLSLPRVINVKFPLQPHQKYYIAQYEDFAFHSLLRRQMIVLPIPTAQLIHFFYRRLGECTFWTRERMRWFWYSSRRPLIYKSSQREVTPRGQQRFEFFSNAKVLCYPGKCRFWCESPYFSVHTAAGDSQVSFVPLYKSTWSEQSRATPTHTMCVREKATCCSQVMPWVPFLLAIVPCEESTLMRQRSNWEGLHIMSPRKVVKRFLFLNHDRFHLKSLTEKVQNNAPSLVKLSELGKHAR